LGAALESGAVQLGSFVFSERHHVQWRRQDSLDPRHALFVPLSSEAEERGLEGEGRRRSASLRSIMLRVTLCIRCG